ncbi:bacterioferritin [Coprothermobacteraceae bacterium]|nr:bacterioferritin [Coprothermobacteraceae bacterium]
MGEWARKYAKGDVNKLIEMLNKAYADEWVAYFYYKAGALALKGLKGKLVADQLAEMAEDEEEHIKELADRIVQLGGTPISSWAGISQHANYPEVAFPQDPTDWKGFLKAVLEAERGAIDYYQHLIDVLTSKDAQEKYGIGNDPVTFHLIRHVLQEEMEHEEEVENLIG